MKATSSPTSTGSGRSSAPGAPSPFELRPLGRVVAGPGTVARLPELVRELGGTRVLLVTDPGLRAAGHADRAERLLADARIAVSVFDDVGENPSDSDVAAGVAAARAHSADILVALGGGSAMDCAKGVNFIRTNGGRMADYRGHGRATRPMLPSLGVPTTSGTGSEAQSYALITDDSSHLKMACGDVKAAFRVSILDPELTVTQPRAVTAVTGIDAVAHALESYVCTKGNPFSRMAARSAWRMLEGSFERVLEVPDDLAARAAMQLGANFAGMAIEASMLGICHSCANPLTAHYGQAHGVAIGLLLPSVLRFNGQAVPGLYADLAEEAGLSNGQPAWETLARRVEAMRDAAGLPTRLRDQGVSDGILHLLASEANEQWTARFNPRPVTEVELEAVYRMAW